MNLLPFGLEGHLAPYMETLWRHRSDDDRLIDDPVHSSIEGLFLSTNQNLTSALR
jgi:hypothetical protein